MLGLMSQVVMTTFHTQDDRTGGEEQQRFEEGMRDQVEHAGHEGAHPDRSHHETQLRDGGIGQDFLDVILPDGNRGREQGCDGAHQCDGGLRSGHKGVEGSGAGNQVNARGNHGGGMDEGRDRGGTRHGIRQPDVEGIWADLPATPTSRNRVIKRITPDGTVTAPAKTSPKVRALEPPEHGEGSQKEAKVTDAVGDHGLLGSIRVCPGGTTERIHFVPEADEQERAQTHAFPADEQHQVGVAADQDHHHGDEQVHEDKETAVTGNIVLETHILVHVADGVDVDQRPDTGDDQHHQDREGIHPEIPGDIQCADVDPVGERDDDRLASATPQGIPEQDGDHKSQPGGSTGDCANGFFVHPPAEDDIDQQPDSGEENDQGNQGEQPGRCHFA